MTNSTAIPAGYEQMDQHTDSFLSFNAGDSVPSEFVDAQQAGWTMTAYNADEDTLECQQDIQDSLEALEEGKGISLEELRSELDA